MSDFRSPNYAHRVLSRRQFLGRAAGAALGTLLWQRQSCRAADNRLAEEIDLRSLRPKVHMRVKSVVVRIKPPYWLGWPGTSYDVEKHRKEYAARFAACAQRVGTALEQVEAPLEDDNAVNAFCEALEKERPDAVLVSIQHMGTWHWADRIARTGVPTIIFAPIGTSFTGHVIEISRRPGVHVVSSLETRGVEQALRMVRAQKQLEASRLLIVAGTDRRETVLDHTGTKVRYVPRRTLHELFARMPTDTPELRAITGEIMGAADRVVEPITQDVMNAARSFCTAKRLLADEGANAISTDCLGMVGSRLVPTPPCMAASLFQDHGVTYGCEADLWAAMGLMLVNYLFDKPGFMNDPVPETVKNRLVVAHCSCGSRLRGYSKPRAPFRLRSHSESNLGVSMQVLWPVGQPATLLSFQGTDTILLDSGTVRGNVDTPPAGGCRTSVELEMDRIADCRDVRGFHQVVFLGDHRRDVEAFCQMHGYKITNSPERPPERV